MKRPATKKVKSKVSGTRKKPRARSKSRRLGATSDIKGMAMKLIGLGAGVLAGRVGNNLIDKAAPTFSPLLSGIAQMGVGFILSTQSKQPFIDDVADGLMGGGFSVTVVALAAGSSLASVISGPNEARSSYEYRRINGPGTRLSIGMGGAQLPMVSGAQLPAVAGLPQRRVRMGRDSMVG